MKTFTGLTVALVFCAFTGGCQPAVRKPVPHIEPETPLAELERLSLQSRPAGAVARLSTGESCKTPCSIQKVPDESFSVTFSKEGYASSTVRVSNNLEALKQFNRRRGMRAEQLSVPSLKFVPNPVSATLEPAWSK